MSQIVIQYHFRNLTPLDRNPSKEAMEITAFKIFNPMACYLKHEHRTKNVALMALLALLFG